MEVHLQRQAAEATLRAANDVLKDTVVETLRTLHPDLLISASVTWDIQERTSHSASEAGPSDG